MDKFSVSMIIGQVIAFTSILFMGIVFYNEGILGRGVLYYEPNRVVALIELATVFVGGLLVAFTLGAFIMGARSDSKKKPEGDDDSMPRESIDRVADGRMWA